ncbi:MAG: hypothetical protein CL489_16370 [Acidobacteria bacterium]|nr:hypothetical protein [Acidobacteriota bacterium]
MPSYIGAPWTVLIDDGTVTTAKLAADAVTGAKLADDAVDSEHYTNGSIDTAHIAADQINATLIADDAIDSEHYTDGSVDLAHFQDVAANSILGRNANSSGVLTEVALTTTQILIGDGTGFTAAAISGNATMTNAGVLSLATAAITGQSELSAETPAVADMFLLYDASASAFKKISALTLGMTWTEVSGNVTLVEGGQYLVDCSSARTVTLPASPAIGDHVRIVDGTGQAATNNITVGRASQPIQGAAADLTIATNRAAIGLVFYNGTHGWLLIEN